MAAIGGVEAGLCVDQRWLEQEVKTTASGVRQVALARVYDEPPADVQTQSEQKVTASGYRPGWAQAEEKVTASGFRPTLQGRARSLQEEEIKGEYDTYRIKRSISRLDAEAIFKQAEIKITIPFGQLRIDDFTLAEGASAAFRIGYAVKKTQFVAIRIFDSRDFALPHLYVLNGLSKHSSVIPHIDRSQSPSHMYLVSPLTGLGSAARLKKEWDQLSDERFKERVLFCIAEALFTTLAKMHKEGFYHLNVNPNDLFVLQNGQVLVDGFNTVTKSDRSIFPLPLSDNIETYSPERRRTFPQSPHFDATKEDGWGAGRTLLILSNYQLELMPKQPEAASLLSLIQALLHSDPDQRLSPTQALQNPWFLKMQAESEMWRSEVSAYFGKIVQQLYSKAETRISKISPQIIPVGTANYIERSQLQEAVVKRLLSKPDTDQVEVTSIQGRAGSGKTELVIRVLQEKRLQAHFGKIFWFSGSSLASQIQTVILARELGIAHEGMTLEEVLNKLHAYLGAQGRPWLMIVDNAEDAIWLSSSRPPKGGHILELTCTEGGKNAISIPPLTPHEGEALIQQLLQRQDPSSRQLCERLEYSPLLISLACNYILMQSNDIAKFLPMLLAIEEPESSVESALWMLILQTIERASRDAFSSLNSLAFYDSDQLSDFIQFDKESLLLRYGVVQSTGRGVSMHRSIQSAVLNYGAKRNVRQKQLLLDSINDLTRLLAMHQMGRDIEQEDIDLDRVARDPACMLHMESVIAFGKAKGWNEGTHDDLHLVHHSVWLAYLYSQLGLVDRQILHLEYAYSKARGSYGPPMLGRICNYLGKALHCKGDLPRSIHHYQEALTIFDTPSRDRALVCRNLGRAHAAANDIYRANKSYAEAIEILKETGPVDALLICAIYNDMGEAYLKIGNNSDAIRQFELAMVRPELSKENPVVATIKHNLGRAYEGLGNLIKASEYYGEALLSLQLHYDVEDPIVQNAILDLRRTQQTRRISVDKTVVTVVRQPLTPHQQKRKNILSFPLIALSSIATGGAIGLGCSLFGNRVQPKVISHQQSVHAGWKWGVIAGTACHAVAMLVRPLFKRRRPAPGIVAFREAEQKRGAVIHLTPRTAARESRDQRLRVAALPFLVPSQEECGRKLEEYFATHGRLTDRMREVMRVQLNSDAPGTERYRIARDFPQECAEFNEAWWMIAAPQFAMARQQFQDNDGLLAAVNKRTEQAVDLICWVDDKNTPENAARAVVGVAVGGMAVTGLASLALKLGGSSSA